MVRLLGAAGAVVLAAGTMLLGDGCVQPPPVAQPRAADKARPDGAQATAPGRQELPHVCKSDDPCCPAAHAGFSYESPVTPKLVERVEPDLADVAAPYPCGVSILQIGVNESGEVVSACVLHSVREDFDRAAQKATRKWRFELRPFRGTGTIPPSEKVIPVVMTVTVTAPGRGCAR